MRVVFVGAGSLTIKTASFLIQRGHELVIVERQRDRIDALSGDLDCGWICGDGTRPAVLRETAAKSSQWLLCLTGDDQTNIIASLVGRSLGFPRVITRIEDEEFEHVCLELGLDAMVIPARTIGRFLSDMLEGQNILELSSALKGDARMFSVIIDADHAGPVTALGLPDRARVSHLYRDGEFLLADAELALKEHDEAVLLVHRDDLEAVRERLGLEPNDS